LTSCNLPLDAHAAVNAAPEPAYIFGIEHHLQHGENQFWKENGKNRPDGPGKKAGVIPAFLYAITW